MCGLLCRVSNSAIEFERPSKGLNPWKLDAFATDNVAFILATLSWKL